MVPGVGIKSLYPVLSVLDQPNGQVLVSQSDVIRKVVYSWVRTDEFSCLWVIVATLIKEDFVELYRCFFSGVATGDTYRESGFGDQTSTFADAWFSWRATLAFVPLLPEMPKRTRRP